MPIVFYESREAQQQHFALVDAVNAAKTEREHDVAEARLQGFREGLRSAGVEPDLCACDWHTIPDLDTRPESECPPVCCGVRLDWKPEVR